MEQEKETKWDLNTILTILFIKCHFMGAEVKDNNKPVPSSFDYKERSYLGAIRKSGSDEIIFDIYRKLSEALPSDNKNETLHYDCIKTCKNCVFFRFCHIDLKTWGPWYQFRYNTGPAIDWWPACNKYWDKMDLNQIRRTSCKPYKVLLDQFLPYGGVVTDSNGKLVGTYGFIKIPTESELPDSVRRILSR